MGRGIGPLKNWQALLERLNPHVQRTSQPSPGITVVALLYVSTSIPTVSRQVFPREEGDALVVCWLVGTIELLREEQLSITSAKEIVPCVPASRQRALHCW